MKTLHACKKRALVNLSVIFVASFLLMGCTFLPKQSAKKPLTDRDLAIQKAQELFKEKQKEGIALIEGPCLSDEIIPDWVADVAHTPRQPVDDLPENQCSAYNSGIAHHFVELDVAGRIIRAE